MPCGVEWAAHGHAAALEDVGVDHGGLDILVAEQVLDGADVVAVLEQVGGEGVAQGVAGDALVDAGQASGAMNGPLQAAGADVVAGTDTGSWIERKGSGPGRDTASASRGGRWGTW